MNDSKFTGCLYCDFGDMEMMRKSGYVEEKYVFCELQGAIVEITKNCPSFSGTHIQEKRDANMNFLIERMAADLDGKI